MDPTKSSKKKPMAFRRMVSNKGNPCTCSSYKENEVSDRIIPHFHCQLCDFTSTYWNCILRHEARCHEYTRPGLNRFKCVSCSRVFVYVYDYVQHLRKHIDEEPDNEQVATEMVRYDSFVGVVSKQPSACVKSTKLSTSAKLEKRPVSARGSMRSNAFHCTKCGFRTRYKHSFFRHETLVHGSEADKDGGVLYECVACNIKTRYKWDYQKHLQTKRHLAAMTSIDHTETLPASQSHSADGQDDALKLSSAIASPQPPLMCKLKVRRTNNEWKCDTVEVSKTPQMSASTVTDSSVCKRPLKIRMPNVLKSGAASKQYSDGSTTQLSVAKQRKQSVHRDPFVSLQRLTFKGNRVFFCCGVQPKLTVNQDTGQPKLTVSRDTGRVTVSRRSGESSIKRHQQTRGAARRLLPLVTGRKFKSAMMYHHMVGTGIKRDRPAAAAAAVKTTAVPEPQSKSSYEELGSVNSGLQESDEEVSTNGDGEASANASFEPVILAAYSVDPGLWCSDNVQTPEPSKDSSESHLQEVPSASEPSCLAAPSGSAGAGSKVPSTKSATVKLAVHVSSVPFDVEPIVFTIAPPVITSFKSPSICATENSCGSPVLKSRLLAGRYAPESRDTLRTAGVTLPRPHVLQVSISSVPFTQCEYEFVIPPYTSSQQCANSSLFNAPPNDSSVVTSCKLSNDVNLYLDSESDDSRLGRDLFAHQSEDGSCSSFKQPHRLRRKQERPQRNNCFIAMASVASDDNCATETDTTADVVDFCAMAVDLQCAGDTCDTDTCSYDGPVYQSPGAALLHDSLLVNPDLDPV